VSDELVDRVGAPGVRVHTRDSLTLHFAEVVGRVWDSYLVTGESAVYRVAVGILTVLRDRLLGHPFEVVMRTLATMPMVSGADTVGVPLLMLFLLYR